MSRRCRGDRGALSVETALVLPALLALVGGALVLGLHMWWSGLVDNAAQAGLRTAQLRQAVIDYDNDSPYAGTSGFHNQEAVLLAVHERLPGTPAPVVCEAGGLPSGATTCARLSAVPGPDEATDVDRTYKVQGDQVAVTVVHRVAVVQAASRFVPVPALADRLAAGLGTITATARGRLE